MRTSQKGSPARVTASAGAGQQSHIHHSVHRASSRGKERSIELMGVGA